MQMMVARSNVYKVWKINLLGPHSAVGRNLILAKVKYKR